MVDQNNKKVKDVELPALFGSEIRPHLIHAAVVNQLANRRAGTASTKNKALVSGGGKKPWKQKGTGRARAGSNRSPLVEAWRHVLWSDAAGLLLFACRKKKSELRLLMR